MKLVIKLYTDKPSRIGILHESHYTASKALNELIEKYNGQAFTLQLEPVNDKVNLTLKPHEAPGKIEYKGLAFDMEQVEKVQQYIAPGMTLQFAHVYMKANQMFVAHRYGEKAKPFTITNYLISFPEGL